MTDKEYEREDDGGETEEDVLAYDQALAAGDSFNGAEREPEPDAPAEPAKPATEEAKMSDPIMTGMPHPADELKEEKPKRARSNAMGLLKKPVETKEKNVTSMTDEHRLRASVKKRVAATVKKVAAKVAAAAPAKPAAAKKVAPVPAKKAAAGKKEFPLCACECGERTKGGRYRPGHDAKHHSRLKAEAAAKVAGGKKGKK